MVEARMRKNFRGNVGIGLLGLWLIGSATTVGRAEAGKASGTDGSEQPQPAIAYPIEPNDKGNIALLNGDWPGQVAPSSTPSPRHCARQVTGQPCSMRRLS